MDNQKKTVPPNLILAMERELNGEPFSFSHSNLEYPNCDIISSQEIFTVKKIEISEEITFDSLPAKYTRIRIETPLFATSKELLEWIKKNFDEKEKDFLIHSYDKEGKLKRKISIHGFFVTSYSLPLNEEENVVVEGSCDHSSQHFLE